MKAVTYIFRHQVSLLRL